MSGIRVRLAVATLAIAAGGIAAAGSSQASVGPVCAGDANVGAFCVTVDPAGLPTVNPTGGPPITDCVFIGPPPCTPVSVPTPAIVPAADPWFVQVACGGPVIDPIIDCFGLVIP